MKAVITFCLAVLISTNLFAQEKEIENFKKEFNSYLDYLSGKNRTIPANEANQIKLRKKVDAAFKEFVLLENSNEYDKLIKARDYNNLKLLYIENKFFIELKTLVADSNTYIFYSYRSGHEFNYFIKDVESNTIVFDGDAKSYLVDDIYKLDDTKFLLVKECGDMNSSREVVVLSSATQPWTVIKAFEGNAFGYSNDGYSVKKFVKRRSAFKLDCEMDYTMSTPADINKISFDSKTKTISYKQFSNDNKPKQINSKWENNVFVIDDYNVGENLSRDAVAVPR